MSASIINLILCGVLLLFVVAGFLWGLKRGIKASGLRGVWLLISIVIFVFLSSVISRAIINSDLLGVLNVTYEGQSVNTVAELVELVVAEYGVSAQNSAEVVALATALVGLALNAIIFLLLFWLAKILLIPLYWIAVRLIFGKSKKYEKTTEIDKNGKEKVVKKRIKVKKHRLAGALVGIVVGLMVFTATFTPIFGYMNIVKTVEDESKKYGKGGMVSDLVGQDNYSMIEEGFYGGVFYGITKYTGIEFLSQATFNTLTTTNLNGEKVKLSDEGVNLVGIYDKVNSLETINLDTCTKEELDDFLTDVNDLVNLAFKSPLISSASEVVVAVGTDILKNNLKIDEMPVYTQTLITNAIANLANLNSQSINSELCGIIGVAKALNDCNVMLPLMQGTTEDTLDLLKNNLTEQNTSNVINKLFELKTVSNLAPDMANAIMGFVADNINEEFNKVGTLENSTLKQNLLNITTSSVAMLQYVEPNSEYYISENGVSAVGKVLDAVLTNSPIIDADFKNKLITEAQKELDKIVNNLGAGTPDYVKTFALGAIDNIGKISNYTIEFEKLQSVVTSFKESLKGQDTNNINVNTINYEMLGEALNTLQNTTLASGNLVKNLFRDVVGELKNDAGVKEYNLQSLAVIEQNLSDPALSVDWKQSLILLEPLIKDANTILQEDDLYGKIKTDSSSIVKLGTDLNNVTSTFIGLNGVNTFVKDMLNVVSDNFTQTSVDVKINDAVTTINNNINVATTYDWENEFRHICNLMQDEYNNVTISVLPSIGEKFDNIIGGYTEGTNTYLPSKIITEKVLDDVIVSAMDSAFNVAEGTQFDVEHIKNAFKDTDTTDDVYTNNITSYKSEFEAFNKIFSIINYTFTADITNAKEMGKIIDDTLKLNSTVITKAFINDYLKKEVASLLPENINDQFKPVVNNIIGSDNGTPADTTDDIASRLDQDITYENEFGALFTLNLILTNTETLSLDNLTTIYPSTAPEQIKGKKVGQILDSVKGSVLVGDAGKIVMASAVDSYDDNAGKYTSILSELKNNVNAIDLNTETPYETAFEDLSKFNTTITSLKDKVESKTIADIDADLGTTLDSTMAGLQELSTIKYNVTAQIAIYAMTEIKNTIGSASTTTTTYIDNYITYLQNVKTDVPYTRTGTPVMSGELQVSTPFYHVYELLSTI